MNRLFFPALLLAPTIVIMAPASADDYLTSSQVQLVLFPKGDTFTEKALVLTKDQIAQIKELSGVRQRAKPPLVWTVYKTTQVQGWIFVDEVVGKHEFITFALGVDVKGQVVGVEIMSYRETHGGQVKEAAWRKNFLGKTSLSPLKLNNDIPNISGATLSCRNVTDGVKRLLILQQLLFKVEAGA